MTDNGRIYFAKTGEQLSEKLCLLPKMANRHGFICGATGTGKTVTLKVLAESFSAMGVPVFLSDVKGDIAGTMKPGEDSDNMRSRIERFGLAADGFSYRGFPVQFFDIFGEKGIPLRTTVSEMGPQLLSRILELNDTQNAVLTVVFKIADDNGLLLIDTKDLKAMLSYVGDSIEQFEMEYGHISKATLTTIIRAVVALESEGGENFFGEPAINIADFFTTDISGQGMITILDAESLIAKPRMYSAFMLYLLSELFEILPEVGDPEKPRLVFFFDEAHLLFNSATPALMEKIEQMIKLIRSKGVGVFFVTQSPSDIPSAVMAQLGNKIEHALRAYTPQEMKTVKNAAASFRENPAFNTEEMLTALGTGEALVSLLDEKGIPGIVQHASILPPASFMGGISDEERQQAIRLSNLYLRYQNPVDRESAYELLISRRKQQEEELSAAREQALQEKEEQKAAEKAEKEAQKAAEKAEKEEQRAAEKAEKESQKAAEKAEKAEQKAQEAAKKKQKTAITSVGKTVTGTIGRQIGGTIGKSIGGSFGKTLGSNLGGSLGRNIFGTLFK